MQNQTSIREGVELLKVLKKFKEDNETYEDVIWDFIEPHLELSKVAKEDIKRSVEEYGSGEFLTLEQVKEELDW